MKISSFITIIALLLLLITPSVADTKLDLPDITYLLFDKISDGHVGDIIEISGSTNLDEGTPVNITLQTNFSVDKAWKYHSTAYIESGKFETEIISSGFAPGKWSATVNDTTGIGDSTFFNLCPVPNITATPSSGCGPLTVQFSLDEFSNLTSFSWYLGDGEISTLMNLIHTYTEPGTYSVNLSFCDNCGCGNITTEIDVFLHPIADFSYENGQFTDNSTNNPTAWNWEFGDGTTSTVQNPCHDYSQDGTYTVTLTVTNDCGSDSVSKDITVKGSEEFSVLLDEGWNIFSTPVALNSGNSTFDEIFSPAEQEKVLVVLGWDGTQWFIPNPSTQIDPLYAYFIKIKDGMTANAVIIPSESVTTLPSRQVNEGINLIGPAPSYDNDSHEFQNMPLDQALVSIEYVGDLTGYIIVVSPNMNQPGWAYAKGGQLKDLLPFKGYWVVMENGPDTLYGFSTTPLFNEG